MRFLVLGVLLMVTTTRSLAETAATAETETLIKRSLVSAGETARLRDVMNKASRGESIVIGTIGGSITEGAVASSSDKRWANLVAEWWRKTFPKAKIAFVNAGIGATGSDIGSH